MAKKKKAPLVPRLGPPKNIRPAGPHKQSDDNERAQVKQSLRKLDPHESELD